tara:strand:- start:332 stop:553 length:222 start_codon:yes stop_codon:yes gene_type:complete
MGVVELVMSIIVGFFAFFVGWLKGCEDEQNRIRRVFSSEGYTYESFRKVLEKHAEQEKAVKSWAKHERKKKKK